MMAEPMLGKPKGRKRNKHSIFKGCEQAHSQGNRRTGNQGGTPAPGSALARQESACL
jgi:hypothetical protein